uniref:Uncharacterized protein n=1 Tax=Aegilops tauschii subsp. strangulata TaxID=200361 RepID=A0A453MYV8_AEGTS
KHPPCSATKLGFESILGPVQGIDTAASPATVVVTKMEEYQGQHGHAVDEYGDPVAGHGNPVAPSAAGAFTGAGGQLQHGREEHKTGGILHRSGSSSSSSVRFRFLRVPFQKTFYFLVGVCFRHMRICGLYVL